MYSRSYSTNPSADGGLMEANGGDGGVRPGYGYANNACLSAFRLQKWPGYPGNSNPGAKRRLTLPAGTRKDWQPTRRTVSGQPTDGPAKKLPVAHGRVFPRLRSISAASQAPFHLLNSFSYICRLFASESRPWTLQLGNGMKPPSLMLVACFVHFIIATHLLLFLIVSPPPLLHPALHAATSSLSLRLVAATL